jgi:hypothetical protein
MPSTVPPETVAILSFAEVQRISSPFEEEAVSSMLSPTLTTASLWLISTFGAGGGGVGMQAFNKSTTANKSAAAHKFFLIFSPFNFDSKSSLII